MHHKSTDTDSRNTKSVEKPSVRTLEEDDTMNDSALTLEKRKPGRPRGAATKRGRGGRPPGRPPKSAPQATDKDKIMDENQSETVSITKHISGMSY